MSQTQAAEGVGKPEINARRFLGSKAIKSLLGKGYTPDTVEIELDPSQLRGRRQFNALPLPVVPEYGIEPWELPKDESEEGVSRQRQQLSRLGLEI